MLKIGLTGGIGSGKSTVANYFSGYAIPIIDADVIAHQLVEPNQYTLSLLQQTFGHFILHQDGSLNRKKLGKIIFADTHKKQQLENILHPLIYQQLQLQSEQQTAAYCILCIPLLMETQMTDFVDRVLVVDCPIEVQIKRVKQRDQQSTEYIKAIIANQVSRQYRLSHADDIIDNAKNTHLAEQIKKLHNDYLLLSLS